MKLCVIFKKKYLTSAVILLPLFIAGYVLWDKNQNESHGAEQLEKPNENTITNSISEENIESHLIDVAFKYYEDKKLAEAYELVKSRTSSFLERENGCELLISIFAEVNDPHLLIKTSEECILRNKVLEIAYEGLGYGYSSLGQIDQAIQKIEKGLKTFPHARLYASLSYLYLMQGEDAKAGENILQAIKVGEPWSQWASAVLENEVYTNNSLFLESLALVMVGKDARIHSLEEKILGIANKKKYQKLQQFLENAKNTNKLNS